MSNLPDASAEPTFHSVRAAIYLALSAIRDKIGPNICSHFNRVPLTMGQALKYCRKTKEIEFWSRPLPTSVKGLTIYAQGIFIVVCNQKERNPLTRLKIILHELGHYLLHREALMHGDCIPARAPFLADEREKEATLFSLMAMVPDDKVKVVIEKHETLEARVRHLEEEYNFTQEEALVRVAAYDVDLQYTPYQQMFKVFFGSEDEL